MMEIAFKVVMVVAFLMLVAVNIGGVDDRRG